MTYVKDCPLCNKVPERCTVARKAVEHCEKQRKAFERSEGRAWATVSMGWFMLGAICGAAVASVWAVLWPQIFH